MSSSSSNGSSTTTVKNLPVWAEGHAKMYLSNAETLSNEAYSNYEEDTFAEQTENEKTAISMFANRGRNGDILINDSITYLETVLNGDYLLGVYSKFISVLDTISTKTNEQFTTVYNLLGGKPYVIGDMSNDNLAQQMSSDIPANSLLRNEAFLYNKNYKTERAIQDESIMHITEHGKQGIVNAEVLRTAGIYQREYNHEAYMDLFKKWYENEMGEVKRLEILGNGVRALIGTQVATTKPYYRPSKVAGVVGGAMSGAMAGYYLLSTTNPIAGAVVGGLIGGIAGGI